jgi:hypothetical protein
MKKLLILTFTALGALAACEKEPSATKDPENTGFSRIETIDQAKDYFDRQLAGGVLAQTTVRLTDETPGGWRMLFTGGTPDVIDLMNGSDPVNGLTPKLIVRHNHDGSTTLWLEENDHLVDTRVTLTKPFENTITPGKTGVPPMVDVRRDAGGRLIVWYTDLYNYPDEGWKNTGVELRSGSGTGSVEQAGPILAIIVNEPRGVVTVWLNDEEHTSYTFGKFSPAFRFNVMNDNLELEEGGTNKLLVIASPSEAWIPTGTGEWIDRWELNDPDLPTRAGYVQPCPNCSIESILPSGRGEGEYIVTIRSHKANFNMIDAGDIHALVLNTNTVRVPKLVSSTRFVINSMLPSRSANSVIVPPNSSVEICMSQVVKEFRAGFVSHPRIGVNDDVKPDWVWAGKPGTTTDGSGNGIITRIETMTPPNSGLNTRFRVTTGPVEGNVVVAVKVDGAIKWSWHIWVTNYDPETENKKFTSTGVTRLAAPDAGKEHTFMDRNMGALSNTHTEDGHDYSAFGMFYQWGRKDPLPGAWYLSAEGALPTVYTPDAPEGKLLPLSSPGMTAGIRYSIEHPGEFIYLPSPLTGFWSWNDLSVESLADLWYDGTDVSFDVVKSVYDPCPSGWRLPSKGILEGFQPQDDPDIVAKYEGNITEELGYVPYAGYMDYLGNIQLGVGRYGFYTSQRDIPIWYSEWGDAVRYETSGGSQFSKYGSNAYSARCIKE